MLTDTIEEGLIDIDQAIVGVSQYINVSPVAINDTYQINEDMLLVVDAMSGLLSNDEDDNYPNALEAVIIDEPSNGILELNPDGSFEYIPNPDFYGLDMFSYSAFDGLVYSATAIAEIFVLSINDTPVADAGGPYQAQADETDTAVINLDATGRYDVESEIVIYAWSWGDTTVYGETAEAVFPVGTSIVILTVTDSEGLSDSDIGLVGVASYGNAIPLAMSDEYTIEEDMILNVSVSEGVLSNDMDDDYPEILTAVLIDNPSH